MWDSNRILWEDDTPKPWEGYRIFDFHTHVYPPRIAAKAVGALNHFYSFVSEGSGTLEDLLEQSGYAGVNGMALLGVATNAGQVEQVNEGVLRSAAAARKEGFRTVAFIGMHQDYPYMSMELRRAKMLGAKGIKLHPDIQKVDVDDPRLCKLYALAKDFDLPICLHMGDNRGDYQYSSPDKLVKVANAFPQVRFVAAHFGAYRAWQESDQLAKLPNVWFDTSSTLGALRTERAMELIDLFGTHRFFFGTDYPVTTAQRELERFFRLPLSDEQRQAILWDNAARFLSL